MFIFNSKKVKSLIVVFAMMLVGSAQSGEGFSSGKMICNVLLSRFDKEVTDLDWVTKWANSKLNVDKYIGECKMEDDRLLLINCYEGDIAKIYISQKKQKAIEKSIRDLW